jgi:hypothetical protein
MFFIFLLFRFAEKGKYFIDFKNGEGAVGEGDPSNKPDVTISMNEEVFLKIFNRESLPLPDAEAGSYDKTLIPKQEKPDLSLVVDYLVAKTFLHVTLTI